MEEWIIPFKGRNPSGCYNQNFLWKHGSIYVMDNHRAALWCWLQEINLKKPHSILHIDQHTDTLQSNMGTWKKYIPKNWTLSIFEYLERKYKLSNDTFPLFRWDNYLSLYFEEFQNSVKTCRFATYEGDKPNFANVINSGIEEIPQNLDYWLDEENGPWIINIDLDYFFSQYDDSAIRMVSPEYLESIFSILKEKLDAGTVKVITI